MSHSPDDLRVLIFAPIGRDSALTVELFKRASIPCHVCGSLADVCHEMSQNAGAVLLTEEALADRAIDDLAHCSRATGVVRHRDPAVRGHGSQ